LTGENGRRKNIAVASPYPALSDPKIIDLWPEGVPGLKANGGPEGIEEESRVNNVHRPTLAFYLAPAAGATGTAMVVCPGGGYVRLSMEYEGRLVAHWLNSLGVTAFVLKSRLKEYGQPAPLQDVLRALRLVRSGAAGFGVRADRVGVLGFSAGGHLAACASTLSGLADGKTGAAIDAVNARPDFALLIYPVITMRPPFVHASSRDALLGPGPQPELVARYSVEQQVTAGAPPTFLVHAQNDALVPVENSIEYYLALRRAGVPAELHLYASGGHGLGMKSEMGGPGEWPRRAEGWLRAHGLLANP